MIYSGQPIEEFIKIEYGKGYFHLTPFLPTPALEKSVNAALSRGWPLLLTGDRYRCMLFGKSLGYDLYGAAFLEFYSRAQVTKNDHFRDLVYFYDYDQRTKDLEYYAITKEKSFLRPADYYLETGPVIELIKVQNERKVRPILEINDLHHASEDFVKDLMDFFLLTRSIRIHETQQEIHRESFELPIIILTADHGYKLPNSFDGIIYAHDLNITKEHLTEETILRYNNSNIEGIDILISKLVELFYLLRNSLLSITNNIDYPNSHLELYNTIDSKIDTITQGEKDLAEVIEEMDEIIQSQLEIARHQDINDLVDETLSLITKANLGRAIDNLEIIVEKFPQDTKANLKTLISRYWELKKIEDLGIESSLTLWPKKNKLVFDLIETLEHSR